MTSYAIEQRVESAVLPEETLEAARRVIDGCQGPADAELVKQILGLKSPPSPVAEAQPEPSDAALAGWFSLNYRCEVHYVLDGGTATCGAYPLGGRTWRELRGVEARDAHRCARCERLLRDQGVQRWPDLTA